MNTELFNTIEANTIVEGQYTARLLAIASERWLVHTRVYGKSWHGVTAFGASTTASALEDGYMLYALVLATKPQIVLEIGSHHGFSTCMIAAALADNHRGLLMSIEASVSNMETAAMNVERFGLANMVRFGLGDAREVLPLLLPKLAAKVEFLFEDGSHEAETIIEELKLLAPYLSDEAYLVFHDSILLDNVAYALTQIEDIIGPCQHVTIGTCRGLDIWRKIYAEG